MYDELVKRLRNCATQAALCDNWSMIEDISCSDTLMKQAADAIAELSKKYLDSEVDNTNLTGWLAEEHAKHLWIPVAERLPDKTNHYLVHIECKCDGELMSKWTQVAWFCKKFYWEHSHGTEFFEETVTHWMPLPEPPMEK